MALLTDEEWTLYLEYKGEQAVLDDTFELEQKRLLGNNAEFNIIKQEHLVYNPPASKREEYSAIERKYLSDIVAIDEKYGFSREFFNATEMITMLLAKPTLFDRDFIKLPPMIQAKYKMIKGNEDKRVQTIYEKIYPPIGGARKVRSRKVRSRKARSRKAHSRRR
jgi:hypothetical protein